MPLSHPLLHPAEPPVIPHSRPAGGQLVDGPATAELERRWCKLTGMTDAAAVGSGTAALRLALLALGVQPGDEVIVPAYSCVALLNAPLSIGAVPVLADVLYGEWTIDPADAVNRLSARTSAIIAVNLFGIPAYIEVLRSHIPIIEDCAHGPILGRGHIGVSSFYATKLIGAGMGGIVAAHDHALTATVRQRRDYGDQPPDGRNENDKLHEDVAGRAVAGLNLLAENCLERWALAARYTEALAGAAVSLPVATDGRVWYRYTPMLPEGLTAPRVVAAMKAQGVHVEQPVWDLRGCDYWRDDLPVASRAFDRLISLPLYPGLTDAEQQRVVDVFQEAIR